MSLKAIQERLYLSEGKEQFVNDTVLFQPQKSQELVAQRVCDEDQRDERDECKDAEESRDCIREVLSTEVLDVSLQEDHRLVLLPTLIDVNHV